MAFLVLKHNLLFIVFILWYGHLSSAAAERSWKIFHDDEYDWVSEQSTAQKRWELKQERIPQEIESYCEAWRFGVETNTIRLWTQVPSDCVEYVQNYMVGSQYSRDLQMVADESIDYASALMASGSGDGMDAWVFDIDETLLSNLPYYVAHQFGGEVFDNSAFNDWVDLAEAPALASSYRLYTHLLELGLKIFLLTGRDETQRNATQKNLVRAGYHTWEALLLRGIDDHGKTAVLYKSEKRLKIEQDGFRIRGNSGDQWSDVYGHATGNRTFKLPNPMYYIA